MLKHWRPFLFGLCVGLLSVALILILNKRQTGAPITLVPPPPTATAVPLRIHVTGAVKSPGVYELPRNSILQDAINAAGGLTESATVEYLNLAELLADGQQVFVAEVIPTAPPPTGGPSPVTDNPSPTPTRQPSAANNPPAPASPGAININTAAQAELETLPRIGPAIAGRIIEYRNAHGPFARIEDIKNVKGIGDATFEALKAYITVK